MKIVKTYLFILALLFSYGVLKAQPMPIELMFWNNYGVFELSFNKSLVKESKLGFFHMNSVEFGYHGEYISIILQNPLYVEALKNLRVAGGLEYTPGGFNPTTGLQYIESRPNFLFLCVPRINIKNDYPYDIMNIIQYTARWTTIWNYSQELNFWMFSCQTEI